MWLQLVLRAPRSQQGGFLCCNVGLITRMTWAASLWDGSLIFSWSTSSAAETSAEVSKASGAHPSGLRVTSCFNHCCSWSCCSRKSEMSLADGANDKSWKPVLVTSCQLSRLSSDVVFTMKPSLILRFPFLSVSSLCFRPQVSPHSFLLCISVHCLPVCTSER